LFVEFPVRIEIPVEVQGAEFEDSFASFQTPACPGDLHAIFDHVTASAFDYARGDGIPLSQVVGIIQIRGMISQLGNTRLSSFFCLTRRCIVDHEIFLKQQPYI
jgi:hypothetical protein